MTDGPSTRQKLTDSPYYWTYLFCTMGLAILIFMGPKIRARQAQIEQNYQGRQRAVERLQGSEPTTPVSTPENNQLQLGPLIVCLVVILCIAWARLWWTHFRVARQPTSTEAS